MAEFRRCPICDASVKLENLERHAARAHPGRKVEFDISEEEKQVIKAKARPRRPMGRTEKVLYPVIVVVVIVAVGISAALLLPGGNQGNGGVGVGDPAPSFALQRSDGEGTLRLTSYRGQVVLLDFMNTDCIFCQQETAFVLTPLSVDNRYENVVVFISVTLNPSTSFAEINAFRQEFGATWPYVRDDGTVGPQYGVGATPTLFILTRNHLVNQIFVGQTPLADVSSALDAALGA